MLVQYLTYFQTYKDSKWLKAFIAYLVLAETLNTGLSIGLLYEPLILKYGQPAATTFFPLVLPAEPIMTVAISTPIQIFIAWRIKIISGRWWIPIIIGILSIISLGGGAWLAYTVIAVQRFVRKPDLHWPALTWLLASAIADVFITATLVFSLTKRKTGFVKTDDIINKIIRMTVQTGLITAIFAVLDVICFLAVPNSTLNFVWDLTLSKLYTNALMSTLNARQALGKMMAPTNVLFSNDSLLRSGNTPDFSFARPKSSDIGPSGTFTPSRRDIEIGIMSVKEVHER